MPQSRKLCKKRGVCQAVGMALKKGGETPPLPVWKIKTLRSKGLLFSTNESLGSQLFSAGGQRTAKEHYPDAENRMQGLDQGW